MYAAVLIFLILFLVFSVLAAVTFGNADLSLKDVYSVILYKLFHIKSLAAYGEGAIHDVVWLIRLPRVLLALAIGMALSVCGVVMQAIVQNPLADPYVLGISSGASLGATLAIMLGIGSFLGGNSVGICAFIGAMLTSFAVIAIANMGGKATSAKLILAGMAISAVCSAFSNFVIYITNDKNAATEVMKWNMGSLAGASWARVSAMMPVTLVCVPYYQPRQHDSAAVHAHAVRAEYPDKQLLHDDKPCCGSGYRSGRYEHEFSYSPLENRVINTVRTQDAYQQKRVYADSGCAYRDCSQKHGPPASQYGIATAPLSASYQSFSAECMEE